MKWHAVVEIGVLGLIVQSGIFGADPDALLSQADHLAEIGNSVKARPLYAEAEQEFRSRGDTKKELYAKFGRLHREVESGSYSAISDELERDLVNPVVQNDPALKIRALSVKGLLLSLRNSDSELDSILANHAESADIAAIPPNGESTTSGETRNFVISRSPVRSRRVAPV